MKFPLGRTFLVLTVGAAAIFVLFPGLDLAVSGLFYRDGDFFLRDNAAVRLLYRYGERPVEIVAGASLILYLTAWARHRASLLGQPRRIWLYFFLAAVLGPGLTVNVILKDHFGRARPIQVREFGGDRVFTRAFDISDQCRHNCSFTCGHCAAGFYFLTFGFVLRGNARRAAFAAGALLGTLLGAARLVQGAHFLSDVVFSLIFVYAVSALLHYAMFREQYIPRIGTA